MENIKVINYLPWFEYTHHQLEQEKRQQRKFRALVLLTILVGLVLIG